VDIVVKINVNIVPGIMVKLKGKTLMTVNNRSNGFAERIKDFQV
jgi:hypothetical protein